MPVVSPPTINGSRKVNQMQSQYIQQHTTTTRSHTPNSRNPITAKRSAGADENPHRYQKYIINANSQATGRTVNKDSDHIEAIKSQPTTQRKKNTKRQNSMEDCTYALNTHHESMAGKLYATTGLEPP